MRTPQSRERVLFAPVPVAPTKPLTLSHIKGLLWADVLRRATGLLHDVDHLHSHTVAHLNGQTLGFWSYLDRVHPGTDYDLLDEEQIGGLYVEFQRRRDAGGPVPAPEDLAARRDAAERHGRLHPAGERVLALWARRFRELGLRDPGLSTRRRPAASLDETVEALTGHGLCVDHRPWRGPVYLDLTARGTALRQIVGADGHPNYLAGTLRELIPLIGAYDRFVLACDRESFADYALLRDVLTALGARVSLVGLGRVRLGGSVRTSRHGGWEGRTAAPLARTFLDRVGPRPYRLGLRLYFIAGLGQGDREPFRTDLLWRCMARAHRLLECSVPAAEHELPELLGRCAHPYGYVHPYRLTTGLLATSRTTTARPLLEEVFL
ncbi:hypothetical protein D7231_16530 [Streptomyces klenkii]|uniref:Uncharacterized protein n=1 Tax=Streptomyces klenkii TaxID=1420899 RepID=A0A3B0BH13_9ACTN|nr:hypothetical protein [Streptomyces klenkii]RKN71609.1 hypothetical protein D7231_16530 [Streptomyces klenkii]